jgi:hypothetical protein
MKRAFLFLVLGPLSVFVTIFVMFVAVSGARSLGVAQCCAMVVAVLTLPVSAITGAVDGFIVPVLPIFFRAPLAALIGATIAWSLACVLTRGLFSPSMSIWWELMPFAIGGAVCMGACSLLSHDYGGLRRPSM